MGAFQGSKYINNIAFLPFSMVNIFIEKTGQKKTMVFEGKVNTLIKKLKYNPETVFVTKKKELLCEEDLIKNTDTIEIRSVISGG